MYSVAWNNFIEFAEKQLLKSNFPPTTEVVCDYIAWLSLKGYASSSIKSYVSALSYHCKIKNVADPTDTFVVKKLLVGLTRIDVRKDIRMPITHEILLKILIALPDVCFSNFEAILFSSLFTVAFYGFLRVGEIVPDSIGRQGHALFKENISYRPTSRSIELFIPHSKTDQCSIGTTILIPATDDSTCPVRSFLAYDSRRPKYPGLYFKHFNGLPVTRYQFSAVLKKALNSAGVNCLLYKTHSFRIGAATSASLAGLPDEEISSFGRWKSNAFKNYIRIPSASLLSRC